MFILTVRVFFSFSFNFSVEDDWTGGDGAGKLFTTGSLPTWCLVCRRPCSVEASPGLVSEGAPSTLPPSSRSLWGGGRSRALERCCNPQESPRGELAARGGGLRPLGSTPGGRQGHLPARPAPAAPLRPGPHCLRHLGCSSQLMEKHVAI